MGLGAAGTAAAIGAGGAIAGGGISALGASSAAGKSSAASAQSAQLQLAEFQQGNAQEQPYIQMGYGAANELSGLASTGNLGVPLPASDMANYPTFNWNPTEAGLQQTPGYQFTLNQGLQATQNAAAAQGLGVSGAALKGAANYATGLADSTYNQQLQNYLATYGQQVGQFQNQFNDYWTQQNNRYQQLAGLATLGANASVGAGSQTVNSAGNVGNAVTAAGQAQAAGTLGTASNLGSGITNALTSPGVQNYLTSPAFSSLFTGGGSTLSAASQPGSTATWYGQA
jgi:hypothetical protein